MRFNLRWDHLVFHPNGNNQPLQQSRTRFAIRRLPMFTVPSLLRLFDRYSSAVVRAAESTSARGAVAELRRTSCFRQRKGLMLSFKVLLHAVVPYS
jgi:hypothetical protein